MLRAASVALLVVSLPAPLLAAEPSATAEDAPAAMQIVDDSESLPPLVPEARDTVGGHLFAGAAFGPVFPLGRLSSEESAGDRLGTGWVVSADLGFGLSRAVVAGAWGSFSRYGDGDCEACDGTGFAVGPFVRYHLVQGTRFTPWLQIGAGYRSLRLERDGSTDDFRGVQWLHGVAGGDYYLFSGFGLSPYFAVDLNSYTDRPRVDGSRGDQRLHVDLSFGLRLLLDLPGR